MAVTIAALEVVSMLGGASAAGHANAMPPRAGPASSAASASAAAIQLSAAAGSLSTGAGPAGGVRADCSATGGTAGELLCQSLSSAAPPRSAAHRISLGPTWSVLPNPVPPPRRDAALVYDARDGYVLLFGGSTPTGSGEFGDTWKYAKGTWTQLGPLSSPVPREGAAVAFDTLDNYVLLYGGRNTTLTMQDTWEFATGQWTKLSPASSPGPLSWASIAYDANTSHVILFGGKNVTSPRAVTWEYAGGVWTRLTPATSPSPREGAAAAYDPKDGWVVVFGGSNGTAVFADTWRFTAGTWTKLVTVRAPPQRTFASAATDPVGRGIVLFGGLNVSAFSSLSDTWNFSSGTWSKVAPPVTPSARYWAGFASGPASGALTLFGGSVPGTGYGNDTWTLKNGVWTHQLILHPYARTLASMVYDEADHYVLLFGGQNNFAPLGDTWKFSHGAWTELHPAVAPTPRYAASIVFDEADGYVLLYGGIGVTGIVVLNDVPLNDTWSFLGGVWTQEPFTPAGPPNEAEAALAYDAADGYVLMYGGDNTSGAFGQTTWTYLNGAWLQQAPSTIPSPIADGSAVYDSTDGYVVLFGINANDLKMETWTWVGGFWTNLTASQVSQPNDRSLFGMTYDSFDGYVVLFGGFRAGTVANDSTQTWSFVGNRWTLLHPATNPGKRGGPSMVYDGSTQQVLLFGGDNDLFGTIGTGVWVY